jgi:hypothetical protein
MEAIAALSFSGESELLEMELEAVGVRATATSGRPFESVRKLHETGGGEMGVWECEPGGIPVFKDGVSEFMHVLKGYARVRGEDGTTHELRAGDSFLAPDQWRGEWEIVETVRKVYVLWKSGAAD